MQPLTWLDVQQAEAEQHLAPNEVSLLFHLLLVSELDSKTTEQ